MSSALARMDAAGFTADLVADGPVLRVAGTDRRFDPIEVAVVETVRFEGTSNPDDEAILFAIASAAGEPIGTFSMPYGPAAGPEESAIVERLHQPPFSAEEIRVHQEHDHITAVFPGREPAEAAVEELRALGLGSEHLGVAVHQGPHVAFEHDAQAELIHDTEIGAQTGAVVGVLTGLALVGLAIPAVGTVGVGGLLAIGVAGGFGGATLGSYIKTAAAKDSLTVHQQLAATPLGPHEVLVAACSHGHPETVQTVLQRHGGRRLSPHDS